jgi:hypothetical protein
MRAAAAKVAEDIGESALASEIRANHDAVFPAAEYLGKLNRLSKGAGNRAYRLAEQQRRNDRRGNES